MANSQGQAHRQMPATDYKNGKMHPISLLSCAHVADLRSFGEYYETIVLCKTCLQYFIQYIVQWLLPTFQHPQKRGLPDLRT